MSTRYQRIQAMENDYSLSALCLAFDVSRSGYYDWCGRKPSARQQANTQLLAEIQTLRQSEEAAYGSPRLTAELQARGYQCSENRIARLMHAHGLRAQARPRFVPCTTDSDHEAFALAGLTIGGVVAIAPANQTISVTHTRNVELRVVVTQTSGWRVHARSHKFTKATPVGVSFGVNCGPGRGLESRNHRKHWGF